MCYVRFVTMTDELLSATHRDVKVTNWATQQTMQQNVIRDLAYLS